jgi:LEA14-like dessication related protein
VDFLFLTLLLAIPFPAPADISVASDPPLTLVIDPSAGAVCSATLTGPAGRAPPGEFRGRVALYDSTATLAISGRGERRGGLLAIRATVRYADVPADWAARFRPGRFALRLTGSIGATPVTWEGRLAWEDVALSGNENVAARFVSLADIEISSFAPSQSRGVARVKAVNPFSFPLTIASSRYRIEAAGREVGQGATRGLLARAGRATVLDFPLTIDHRQLLAAAGSAFVMSGEVDARLKGEVTVRLPGGDVMIPLDLSGRLSAGDLVGRL